MLRTIKLDNNFCACTIKINNIRTYYFLAIYGVRDFFEKIIPQMPFFFGHVISKSF